ncbi:MAG: glycosyltransferase family 2 protein [Nitrospinota bacterium]
MENSKPKLSSIIVSVIIPCRNEAEFIAGCLDSILANDYPTKKMEIFVVDGMSEDGTREIVGTYTQKHTHIKRLDNIQKITPVALNIGITQARGKFILWMSAHNHYDKRYISCCVESVTRYKADNVGGGIITVPRDCTVIGRATVEALSHSFGVGNSSFRTQLKEPKWVDTVFGGCYRKEVFDYVGLFNEKLARGQDMEFNLRLKKAGGRTLLVPDIVSYYYARSDLKSFLKHNWTNGVWAILPFAYSDVVPVSLRHVVPLFFVTSLLVSGFLSFAFTPFLGLFLFVAGAYLIVNLTASTQLAWKKRDVRYPFLMSAIFATLHFSYGLGALWGVVRLFALPDFWRRIWRRILKR